MHERDPPDQILRLSQHPNRLMQRICRLHLHAGLYLFLQRHMKCLSHIQRNFIGYRPRRPDDALEPDVQHHRRKMNCFFRQLLVSYGCLTSLPKAE